MKLLKLFMSLSLSCLLLCSCEKPYPEEDNVPDINTGENNKPSGGDNTPGGNSGTGKYSTGDVVTVQEFIDNEINCQVFVVGYIVGDCTKSISNAEFAPPFTQPQALLIADGHERGQHGQSGVNTIEIRFEVETELKSRGQSPTTPPQDNGLRI